MTTTAVDQENRPKTFGKTYLYPDGTYDIVAANRPIFAPKVERPKAPRKPREPQEDTKPKAKKTDLERAQRRARANVRRLALANDFRWFVTLTINPEKVDSYDSQACTRRLGQWLSNHVRRNGLRYVLVPERHKSGRIHYHGFFSDSVEAVDSGHTDKAGHPVYNLPEWDYGFTTAIELYGEYHAAVGYVCKYIGKDAEKIGGRWYYSGGQLEKPAEKFVDISWADLQEMQTEEFKEQYGQGWLKATPGGLFAGINGVRLEEYDGEH